MNNGFVEKKFKGRRHLTISALLNVALLIATVGGMIWAMESRYAKAKEIDNIFTAIQKVHCETIRGRIVDLRTKIIISGGSNQDELDWQELQDKKIRICGGANREEYPA